MGKIRRLYLSPEAYEDFQLITEPLRARVLRRLRMLKQFPKMGKSMPGEFAGFRATTVELFRIFYRVTDRGVEVAYIRHCKRQLPQTTTRRGK